MFACIIVSTFRHVFIVYFVLHFKLAFMCLDAYCYKNYIEKICDNFNQGVTKVQNGVARTIWWTLTSTQLNEVKTFSHASRSIIYTQTDKVGLHVHTPII